MKGYNQVYYTQKQICLLVHMKEEDTVSKNGEKKEKLRGR